jgi:hypothetical protein
MIPLLRLPHAIGSLVELDQDILASPIVDDTFCFQYSLTNICPRIQLSLVIEYWAQALRTSHCQQTDSYVGRGFGLMRR